LDLELSQGTWAASWLELTSAAGFQYFRQTATLDQFQATATLLGQAGRVITAVTFNDSGDVYFLNYGWSTDTSTTYDTKVAFATFDTVGKKATDLANAGYIITALGGNHTSGLVLVGTRVQGDTMPRSTIVVTPKTGFDLGPLFQSGDAIVGYILNSDFSLTWIGEQ
jgi:hypothetical protein